MSLTKSLILTLACIFSASYSYAGELEDFLLQQISAKEFLSEHYIDEYQALNIMDNEYSILNKNDLKEMFELAGEQISATKITSFRVMSRADTESFTSVTFEYEWDLKMGNTQMNGKVSGVGVFMKTNEGYISIFDAQTT